MKARGQIFTLDVVLGAVLFLVALISVLYLWDTTTEGIQKSESYYEMEHMADSAVEQLVRAPGNPVNWTKDDVKVYGLADVREFMGVFKSEDRVLDPDKFLEMLWLTKNKNRDVRDRLIGVGKYKFYVEVSCLNESQTTCFNGLYLDRVKYDVECSNDFSITVDVPNSMTDSHVWVEAEDVFGNNVSTNCYKGPCSGGQMSLVEGEVSTVITAFGLNKVWVRLYDDSLGLWVSVGGQSALVESTNNHTVKWLSAGIYNLSGLATFGLNSTGKLVDALLVTSNMLYNPGEKNLPIGNPRPENNCIVGEYIGNKGLIVSSEKTATFSIKDIGYGFGVNDTMRIKVVLWTEEPTIPTTTTTTTLFPVELGCFPPTPPLINYCSEFKAVDGIAGLAAPSTLICGESSEVTVTWNGVHNQDPNYWGFFLNSSREEYLYLDSCVSMSGETENTTYMMTCTLHMPPELDALNGTYSLTLTADDGAPDAGGYCTPTEPYVDYLKSTTVELKGCREYSPIECVGPIAGPRPCSNNTIHTLEVDAPDSSPCSSEINVDVLWSGYHGDHVGDNHTYFGFFIDGFGWNIGGCRSTNTEDSDVSYYAMECNIWLPSMSSGEHTLMVSANDKYGFCSNLDYIHANDTILVSGCSLIIQNAQINPASGPPGTIFTITADISDPAGVDPATTIAHIQNPDETDVVLVTLVELAGGGTYTGTWDSTDFPEGAYFVDMTACNLNPIVECREVENI